MDLQIQPAKLKSGNYKRVPIKRNTLINNKNHGTNERILLLRTPTAI
jgi:hypothetical protein